MCFLPFPFQGQITVICLFFAMWLHTMVLILDGNSEHVAHALRKIRLLDNNIRVVTVLELIECLNHIK